MLSLVLPSIKRMGRSAIGMLALSLAHSAMADECPDIAGTYGATSEVIELQGENRMISEGFFATARWLLLGYDAKEAPKEKVLTVASGDLLVIRFEESNSILLMAAYGVKGTPKTVMASRSEGGFSCRGGVLEFRPWETQGSGDGGRFRTIETRSMYRAPSGDLVLRLHQRRERLDLFVFHGANETTGLFRFRAVKTP